MTGPLCLGTPLETSCIIFPLKICSAKPPKVVFKFWNNWYLYSLRRPYLNRKYPITQYLQVYQVYYYYYFSSDKCKESFITQLHTCLNLKVLKGTKKHLFFPFSLDEDQLSYSSPPIAGSFPPISPLALPSYSPHSYLADPAPGLVGGALLDSSIPVGGSGVPAPGPVMLTLDEAPPDTKTRLSRSKSGEL
jgi:hypothetical protein